jgi:hypothetical protein
MKVEIVSLMMSPKTIEVRMSMKKMNQLCLFSNIKVIHLVNKYHQKHLI